MIEEKTSLVREFSLLFGLLFFSLFIFQEVLFSLIPVILVLILFGLLWSLLRLERWKLADTIVTNAGAVGILVWLVYAFLHSYFGYKEVVLILLKADIFLITLFCFCASAARNRTYIIFLSVPLCAGALLYSRHSFVLSGFFLLGVFFCWLALLRVRFDQVFRFRESFGRVWWEFLIIPGVSCAVVVLSASLIFFFLHAPYLKKIGFFDSTDVTDSGELEALEKEYYAKQDAFQEQASKTALNFQVSDDRHVLMKTISFMIQENPEITDVEKGTLETLSLLRIPGLGIQKAERDEVDHTLREYLEIKAEVNVIRESDKLMQKAREKEANVFEAVSMLFSLGSLRFSATQKAITAAGKRLEKDIKALGASGAREKDFKQQARNLKQWKNLGMFLKQERLLKSELESAAADVRGDFLTAITHVEDIRTVENMREVLSEVARVKKKYPAAQTHARRLDEIMALRSEIYLFLKEAEMLARLKDYGVSPQTMERIEKSFEVLRSAPMLHFQKGLNEDVVRLESEKLVSELHTIADENVLPQKEERELVKDVESLKKILLSEVKKEQVRLQRALKDEEAKKFQAKPSFRLRKYLRFLPFVFLFIACALSVFFAYRLFVTWRMKRRIAAELNNPRRFIVTLYAHMQRIIAVFGMSFKEEFPPLLRAYSIGGIYRIPIVDLVVFSEKFEEARYSRHVLTSEDAHEALKAYNGFLHVLLKRDNFFVRFQKVFLSVLRGIPLGILKT